MANLRANLIGSALILLGVLIFLFSEQIVFPGLERLVGVETIVGTNNVVHKADGSYFVTNPGAMVRWIASVATIGVAMFFLGLLVLVRGRRAHHKGSGAVVS